MMIFYFFRVQVLRKMPKPPRFPAHLKPASERPRFMASLRDKRSGEPTATTIATAIAAAPTTTTSTFASLDELATIASVMVNSTHTVPLPSELASPSSYKAAQAVVWRPPLPKTMRQYELAAQADDSTNITGAHFQPAQYSQVYCLIHQHVQLVLQTATMAAAVGDQESMAASSKMLRDFGEFIASQTEVRKITGVPPYVAGCLGIDTGEGIDNITTTTGATTTTTNGGGGGGGGGNSPLFFGSSWTPQNPGNVYTVADVAVLRAGLRTLDVMLNVQTVLHGGVNNQQAGQPPSGSENVAGQQQQQQEEQQHVPGEGGDDVEMVAAVMPPTRTGSTRRKRRRREEEAVVVETTTTTAAAAAAVESAAEVQPAKPAKKRRRNRGPTSHPVWDALPAEIALSLVPAQRFFDPGLEPTAPKFYRTAQMLFTPAEDVLLAWGIRKYVFLKDFSFYLSSIYYQVCCVCFSI